MLAKIYLSREGQSIAKQVANFGFPSFLDEEELTVNTLKSMSSALHIGSCMLLDAKSPFAFA